jgi:hypothetical protein
VLVYLTVVRRSLIKATLAATVSVITKVAVVAVVAAAQAQTVVMPTVGTAAQA